MSTATIANFEQNQAMISKHSGQLAVAHHRDNSAQWLTLIARPVTMLRRFIRPASLSDRTSRSVNVSHPPPATPSATEIIKQRRLRVQKIRDDVRARHESGESAIATSVWLSDQLDDLIADILNDRLGGSHARLKELFSVIAVGGNGRQRPAPYSDIDLLVIVDPKSASSVQPVIEAFIRDLWDLALQIGSSVRTPADVIRFANEDIQFATSLIEMRLVAGNIPFFHDLTVQVRQRVFPDKSAHMIQRFVTSRHEEWMARGNSVNQLEPDVKRSPGGLRDLHLLRWVAFAKYGTVDMSALLNAHEVSEDELAALHAADEYLTGLRLDLHLGSRLKQDILTRDLQLDISRERGVTSPDGMRPVVAFMQEYFGHTSRVAEVARRVAELPKRPGLLTRIRRAILPSRSALGLMMVDGTVVVPEEKLVLLADNPAVIMDIFVFAAENKATLSSELRQVIGEQAACLPAEPDHEVCRRFRSVLRAIDGLADTLRAMYETGFLEWLVPPFREIRCLIQFNQYHSFTVDEHTLKAIDEVAGFAHDDSPVGSAYRTVRHRATLHMALLMHDVGKGRPGDHSDVGAALCEGVGMRLQMAENKKTMMTMLVQHHLVMPNLAFRRDTTDSGVLVEFARLVGAPELLRMLYVLTVADIKAVGPDVWSDWKGELLADLYNRTMQVLSGRPYNHLERERLQLVRNAVHGSIAPVGINDADKDLSAWIDNQCDALPPFYLMTEQPDRIARDLGMIQQLGDDEVLIEGIFEADTSTVTYRVFAAAKYEAGSFHKIAGILSGLRMNILTGQTCTTADGVLIASFRVTDNDFTGPVPLSRIQDVGKGIRNVLTGQITVDSVFRRSSLFRLNRKNKRVVTTKPQVTIDNDCSERFSVIDVFAADSQGLLYTMALTLFQHDVQIQLARIATHVDQVVDVFYVLDAHGHKITDEERLQHLLESLLHEIEQLSAD